MNYLQLNKESWNKRVAPHIASDFYDVPGFIAGKSSLNSIELALLGDVSKKKILHLQCHFGMDTLSLARLGADVTGIDLSDAAILEARNLAEKIGQPAKFIEANVYDTLLHVEINSFDIVFSSYGTIGWLPELDTWAAVIAGALKKGGKFVFVEFHPVLWMLDSTGTSIQHNYFNESPFLETEHGTYADVNAPIEHTNVSWNHSLSDVISSLLQHKLRITAFQEYDYSPYNIFEHADEFRPGCFRHAKATAKIPMLYALTAEK